MPSSGAAFKHDQLEVFAYAPGGYQRFYQKTNTTAKPQQSPTRQQISYQGKLHHMKVSSLAPKDHKVKDDKDHAISSRRAKKARARTRNFKASRAAKNRALD